MPALGFIPQGQFAFPRSYCGGIEIRHDISAPSWSGNLVQFWIAGSPDALCVVTFQPNFIEWSSNRYTLDYVVDQAVYSYPPNPTVFDLPYYLVWRVPNVGARPGILFDVTYGGTYSVHALPPQPTDYWLPQPFA